MLTATAFIWGVTFVAQTRGMEHVGPLTFNAARSILACAALFVAALFFPQIGNRKAVWRAGIICGGVLAAATALQQTGLQYTTVGRAGFVSSLYVVIVPVFEFLFFGRKTPVHIILCVFAALLGVWLLCADNMAGIGGGDALILASAVLFALHIILLSHFSPKVPIIWLACIQFGVCAILNTAAALSFEEITVPALFAASGSIVFAGLLSSGLAYTLQIVALKRVNPTVASLIFCLESVFALFAGWVWLGERLSGQEWTGCIIVFTAIVISQLQIPKIKLRQPEK